MFFLRLVNMTLAIIRLPVLFCLPVNNTENAIAAIESTRARYNTPFPFEDYMTPPYATRSPQIGFVQVGEEHHAEIYFINI